MRAMMLTSALVLVMGCTTEFKDSTGDTAQDTSVPTDTSVDTGPPDTAPDPGPDTPTDTGVPDTASDTVTWDTAPDTSDCVPITADKGGTCNILEQCGCPDDTWWCMFGIDFTNCNVIEQCTASEPGTRFVGDLCDATASNRCAPGLECLMDVTGGHRCFQYCLSDGDCILDDETCWMPLDMYGSGPCEGDPMHVPLLLCSPEEPTCVQQCDGPFDTTGCPIGQVCTYDAECDTLACFMPGDVPVGEECEDLLECEAGAICITDGTGTSGFCASWCDEYHTCPVGYTCSPLSLPSFPELSVCA